MRSRVVRAWTICTVRRLPGWVRFCMVGLNVGSEAGGISPEISLAWVVYTAGGISTSAIINSIPDVRSATFKGVRPSGGPNQVWREATAHQRVGGRAKKTEPAAADPVLNGWIVEDYAALAFLAIVGRAGFGWAFAAVFLADCAFSFAANSALTFCAMASVSTL